MTKVYRVEDPIRGEGLWRNIFGEHSPVFDRLTDGKVREMPMDDAPEIYQQGGKHWFASAPTSETLQHWFSIQDLEELEAIEYGIFEIEVKNEKVLNPFETIFTRDNIISMKKIGIADIYPEYKKN